MTFEADFYQRRVAKVLTYIASHIDDESPDFSLDALADLAGMSKFHFHRQFAAITGITVARLVTVLRLKRASMRLAFGSNDRVTDIAFDSGYGSVEAFSRAFREVQGQSPTEFRSQPTWEHWSNVFRTSYSNKELFMKVEVVQFPETQVAVLEHRGPPTTLMPSVAKFIEWRKATNESPVRTSQTYGIVYADPDSVPPEDFRFDICGTIRAPVAENKWGIVSKRIEGGTCAVTTHLGSTDAIGPSVMRLYREWLPTSGHTIRDAPLFFHYKLRMPDVSEPEQVTDIYLPLR